jgi:hypothetical protein
MYRLWLLAAVLVMSGCGRFYPGPLQPTSQQASEMTVNDDGSVTFSLDRLAITLQPMTDAQLNRQFAGASAQGAKSTNPYTFGNWKPTGDEWTPPRFNVFLITMSNYQYPKVLLNPLNATITTANNRQYQAFSFAQLDEYFRAYWLGRTGQGRERFENRTDLLRRTLYSSSMVFSGQEEKGFVVFPALHDDVEKVEVHIEDIALRFNYAGQPVESIDIDFSFEREVFRGYEPPPELAQQ